MPGLHMRMAGRIRLRHAPAGKEKYDPMFMAATVDMATGCGAGGCAAGATGQWSQEAKAEIVEQHCDPEFGVTQGVIGRGPAPQRSGKGLRLLADATCMQHG